MIKRKGTVIIYPATLVIMNEMGEMTAFMTEALGFSFESAKETFAELELMFGSLDYQSFGELLG